MNMTNLTQRLLLIYSGVLTVVLCVVLLAGFTAAPKKTSFDEIDVQRINLVEPDGTIRLAISNKAKFPGLILKGKEYPYDRNTAGMIFFDDEGTENGGLIFGGFKSAAGKVQAWGHLSFDQYMQDQVFSIDANEEDGQRNNQLQLIDEPDAAEAPLSNVADALQQVAKLPAEQRRAKLHELLANQPKAHTRMYLGRGGDQSVALRLKDVQGRDRIVIMVAPDGTPKLQFLDDKGKILTQLPPA